MPETQIRRTRGVTKEDVLRAALQNPNTVIRELNNRSFYDFLQHFWHLVSPHAFKPNWHIKYLCEELEKVAHQVGQKLPRKHDLIINVPPGSTKTITCTIMFPVWCWAHVGYWMRFICASYSAPLSLESADYCRELVKSPEFRELYPELEIKDDKDTKSNFKITKKIQTAIGREPRRLTGGNRFSTSVGGTLTGFHGDILIVDDPLKPDEAASEVSLATANRWIEQTLSTRKTDKAITPTILIMQRLHQDDPSGHMLEKMKENVKHICIPGEARNYKDKIKPAELYKYYIDDLMDPIRMPWSVLRDMEADLGQYGYSGQVGQEPTPPGGGMFRVDHLSMLSSMPHQNLIRHTVRYWDKASTQDAGAYTVGVKMSQLTNGRWVIEDVKRGRWNTDEREAIIKGTAQADGQRVTIWVEQEPGSSGKDSVKGTIRNLAGYTTYAERPTGDKVFRADPFSVQVNNDNVSLLTAGWNRDFVEELRFFPVGTYKDQVDASSGAFSKLINKKIARRI